MKNDGKTNSAKKYSAERFSVRGWGILLKTELLMFLRDFFGVFFTLVFPVLMLVLFGSIYGNEPFFPGGTQGIMDVSVPAYSVMVIGVTGLMSFPLTLAECRDKKIYKRFDASPAGKKRIILAQVAVNLLMTLVGIGLLLAAGRILYGVKIQGSALEVSVGLLLGVAALFSMGFLFTAVGRDAKISNLLCYLSYFVMLFLSGATMPDMLFPDAVKTAARLLPMTYAVDLLQGVFAGDGLSVHGAELLVLGAVTAVFALTGALLYRRKDWT